ncbi:DUF1146 domain-containing protein [Macrococcus hajekii]|uniref:DUF1146 domain-containing protein n=1 Tax=Macrococcus hajekii TaxID=198482 RepID=A0A4R6BI17_9STAP|nr:DUF1146 family protein [Macrococcus hajekii]TDM01099.1 DUF1146 domain-containing protein [Macrococcus hajekii]GGB12403.1 hypothetical protein GCM10007190_20670 [Macrococcus hajekii]
MDIGIYALVHIALHVICTCMSFWALKSLRTEHWFKANHTQQVQVLIVIMSFALGKLISDFIMDIIYFSQQAAWL